MNIFKFKLSLKYWHLFRECLLVAIKELKPMVPFVMNIRDMRLVIVRARRLFKEAKKGSNN